MIYQGHQEAPPERGYERVEISLVEGWETCRLKRSNRAILLRDSFYDCEKDKKTLWFCDLLIF